MHWDHRVVFPKGVDGYGIDATTRLGELQRQLDEIGQAGWEMIAATGLNSGQGTKRMVWYFKRPAKQDQPAP